MKAQLLIVFILFTPTFNSELMLPSCLQTIKYSLKRPDFVVEEEFQTFLLAVMDYQNYTPTWGIDLHKDQPEG